jgi:hypothetical protein
VDAGFYPHLDLVQPQNRIRVWADATHDPVSVLRFESEETPTWPDWDGARDWRWHGTMTSAVAAGNGFLSHGFDPSPPLAGIEESGFPVTLGVLAMIIFTAIAMGCDQAIQHCRPEKSIGGAG